MRWSWGLAVIVGTVAGCAINDINLGYPCPDFDKHHVDENGNPDPCHEHDRDAGTDAADDASADAGDDAGATDAG